jgi:hypothetical protein
MRHVAIAWLLLVGQAAVPAVPTEPIAALIDAFRTHSVVALGEGSHGNDQSHAFRLALVSDRRFPAAVNDIVIEGASASYQEIVDKFVSGGDISEAAVRAAWENSTQTQLALTGPGTTAFARAVRVVNARLPKRRQLRVLLGDPPIDWSLIHSSDDYLKVLALRDSFPADLIRREVLAKHRRALVVFGDMHFQRKQLFSNYDMSSAIAQTVVSLLESGPQAIKVFTVTSATDTDLVALQPDVATWRVPSFVLLRGTVLGREDFTKFYASPRTPPPLRMEDQFDALMYFGAKSSITFAPPSKDRCSDRAYIDTHLARMSLSDLPQSVIDGVKRTCE